MKGNKMDLKVARNLSYVSQIAFLILTPIIAGVYIGNYLDEKLGTAPWLMLLLTIVGVGVGFVSLFKFATSAIENPEKKEDYVPNSRDDEEK